MPERDRDRVYALLVVAFALAALLVRVLAEPVDHGYVRYAGIAHAAVRSGDWVVLRLGDALYVNKPPLFVWLIALAQELADRGRGAGPMAGWVGHVPNLVALALFAVFGWRLGRRLFARADAAAAGVLVLLTSVELLTLLRDKRIDPLFGAFLLVAADAFHAAWTAAPGAPGRAGRWRGALVAGVALAAATLTKGPLGVLFFGTAALALAVWERRVRDLLRPEWLASAGLCVALSAVWPALLVQRLGGIEPTLAALRAVDLTTREGGPLHYALNLPVQWLPWTLFAPALALHLRGAFGGARGAAARFLLVGFASVLVLLHFSETKHSRYLLPAFPFLSLLLLLLWFEPGTGREAQLAPRAARWRDGAMQTALWGCLVASLVGLAALPFLPDGRVPVAIAAALGAWGAVHGVRALRAGGPPAAALVRLGLLALLAIAAYDGARAERLAERDDTRAARAALAPSLAATAAGGAEPALLVGLDEGPTLVLPLLTGEAHPHVASAAQAAERVLAAGGAPVWIVASPGDASALGADPRLRVDAAAPFEVDRTDLVILAARPARPEP